MRLLRIRGEVVNTELLIEVMRSQYESSSLLVKPSKACGIRHLGYYASTG
jgi:hypothetical protein